MPFNFLKTVVTNIIRGGGVSLAFALAFHATAYSQTQTFANWSSSTAFRLGNVSCTAALGASLNQGGALLQNPVTLDGSTNYPSSWFTPTPPVGTKWSTGNLTNANASQQFTVTCLQAIPTPRMHVVNLDTSQLELTTSGPTVSRLSGNSAFSVSGAILNDDYGVATNGGCDTSPSGGNPNGACGTVEISGSRTTLSFTNRRLISSGDGWSWTLSANAWSIGGAVSGLGASKNVVLQNNLGDNVTVAADGSFTFPSGNIDTTTYSVTVMTQPVGQICTVTNATGTANANVSNVTVSCVSSPTVTAVSPSSDTTAGGTSITITGTDFTNATSVTIGGNVCTNVVVVSATSITCTTPAGTVGNASVLVMTPVGTSVANTLFTYFVPVVAAPIPTLSEWAMIFVASLMAMFGIRRMRRQ